jgi:hypothetical protein
MLKKTLSNLLKSLFILFFISYSFPQGKTGSILGKVLDRVTQQSLSGVSVSILDTEFRTETNSQGQFRFDNIPVGSYQILFDKEKYFPVIKSDVVVDTGHINQQLIEMDISVVEEEIIVTPDYFSKQQSYSPSTRNLSYEEIRRMPGAYEDISRAILSMPGVSGSGDIKNDIIVRGGNPSENLFVVDNIQIANINHFGSQGASGGGIGFVNTDFVHDINFYSGGFPSLYGDKLSSATEIILREGSRSRFSGDVNLSMAGFGGTFEGPLFSDKGSWIISLRRSYLELLSGFSLGLTATPEFWDFQIKTVYDLSNNHQLSFLGIGAIDKIEIKDFDDPVMNYLAMENNQASYVFGLNLKSVWGKKGYSIFSISRSLYKYYYDVDEKEGKLLRSDSTEEEIATKYDFQIRLKPKIQFATGISLRWIKSSYDILQKEGLDPFGYYQPHKDIHLDISTYKAAAYVQFGLHFGFRLHGTIGLRGDYFKYIDKFSISPRIALSYSISRLHTLNISYGVYFQSPEYIWLIAHPKNYLLGFLQANHFVLGWQYLWRNDVKISIEIFNKRYKHYPVDKNNPFFILANSGKNFGPSFIGGRLLSEGTGFARGIEFFCQKKFAQKLYGLLNYSYSIVKFQALDGISRAGNYDYRHIFTCLLGYKPSETWELSVKWRYTGGRPYIPYDEELSKHCGSARRDLNQINTLRYPSYHRLDLRADRRFYFNNWNLIIYVDLQNVYNRSNVYGYVWSTVEEEVKTVYQWQILPVLGFSIEF